MKVGVEPSDLPLLSWIVRLCASGEELEKSNVVLPDFALRLLVSNLNCPLGSAESFSVWLPPPPPPPPPAEAPPADVLELELELLLDPHAARASAAVNAV